MSNISTKTNNVVPTITTTTTTTTEDVTCLDYHDLFHYESSSTMTSVCEHAIQQAFAHPNAFGLLCITNIPPLPPIYEYEYEYDYMHLRTKLLTLSRVLGEEVSDTCRDKLTRSDAAYQVGWSHGVEKLANDDDDHTNNNNMYDYSKGSYYANPLVDDYVHDIPGVVAELMEDEQCRLAAGITNNIESSSSSSITSTNQRQKLEAWISKNHIFFAANLWPNQGEDNGVLDELGSSFKTMGKFLHQVAVKVGQVMDGYVQQVDSSFDGHLSKVLKDSRYCKGRLLHYFAQSQDDTTKSTSNGVGDWCGWHNDHGSLTALVPAMYLDSNGCEIEPPDSEAGLYVMSRQGVLKQIQMPKNSIGFQVGETTQIHTGGILQATPHCVRGYRMSNTSTNITRETFAVFFEPEYHHDMKVHLDTTNRYIEPETQEARQFLPPNVKPINSRWKRGMNFGEFSLATFEAFH